MYMVFGISIKKLAKRLRRAICRKYVYNINCNEKGIDFVYFFVSRPIVNINKICNKIYNLFLILSEIALLNAYR